MKTSAFSVFSILFATLVAAQEPRPGEESGRKGDKHHGPDFREFVKHHDQNGDGKVSPEEFASGERAARLSEEAREKIFNRLDKDGDGFITSKEMKGRGRGHGQALLKKADADGDGRISREEFLADPPFKKVDEERLNKMFDRMDQNKDGFLDKKDFDANRGRGRPPGGRPPWANLKELDLDKNGTVSREEFGKGEFIQKMPEKHREGLFERIDSDGNGEISAEEIREQLRKGPPRDHKGGSPRGPKDSKEPKK